ncbi:1350_t:CDS:10 [Rhizophagus irregularis]|nr:1350_t:CDS:10 [Rhizophagus irregularis]
MSDNSINPEIEWKLELYNCDGLPIWELLSCSWFGSGPRYLCGVSFYEDNFKIIPEKLKSQNGQGNLDYVIECGKIFGEVKREDFMKRFAHTSVQMESKRKANDRRRKRSDEFIDLVYKERLAMKLDEKKFQRLKSGANFMIVDCGGGAVDLTMRKLTGNNQISEIQEIIVESKRVARKWKERKRKKFQPMDPRLQFRAPYLGLLGLTKEPLAPRLLISFKALLKSISSTKKCQKSEIISIVNEAGNEADKAESKVQDSISISEEDDDSDYVLPEEEEDSDYVASDDEDQNPSPLLTSSQFKCFAESLIHSWIIDLNDREAEAQFTVEEWKEIRCEIRKLPEFDESFVDSMMRFADTFLSSSLSPIGYGLNGTEPTRSNNDVSKLTVWPDIAFTYYKDTDNLDRGS